VSVLCCIAVIKLSINFIQYMVASKLSWITSFLRNTKQYNVLSYISFKIVPLCNYSFLPATVKVLETFLETILWKTFQLLHCFINDVISITDILSPHCWFQLKDRVKKQLQPGQESMGDAPVLLHCSLLRNPWPKLTGVLEHCFEIETKCWFFIFQGISFWPHP